MLRRFSQGLCRDSEDNEGVEDWKFLGILGLFFCVLVILRILWSWGLFGEALIQEMLPKITVLAYPRDLHIRSAPYYACLQVS